MAAIINVIGNSCICSDIVDNLSVENILFVCERFTSEHYVMPEEIFVIASGKLIEIDLESVLQSELDKLL